MDKALREEFRAYKAEAEDRINRLEKAVKALSEPLALKSAGGDAKPSPAPSGEKKS